MHQAKDVAVTLQCFDIFTLSALIINCGKRNVPQPSMGHEKKSLSNEWPILPILEFHSTNSVVVSVASRESCQDSQPVGETS